MDGLGVTLSLLTRVLDGAVYLNSETHDDLVARRELTTSLLGQEKRIQQLQHELEAERKSREVAESRLKESAQLIATLRGELRFLGSRE